MPVDQGRGDDSHENDQNTDVDAAEEATSTSSGPVETNREQTNSKKKKKKTAKAKGNEHKKLAESTTKASQAVSSTFLSDKATDGSATPSFDVNDRERRAKLAQRGRYASYILQLTQQSFRDTVHPERQDQHDGDDDDHDHNQQTKDHSETRSSSNRMTDARSHAALRHCAVEDHDNCKPLSQPTKADDKTKSDGNDGEDDRRLHVERGSLPAGAYAVNSRQLVNRRHGSGENGQDDEDENLFDGTFHGNIDVLLRQHHTMDNQNNAQEQPIAVTEATAVPSVEELEGQIRRRILSETVAASTVTPVPDDSHHQSTDDCPSADDDNTKQSENMLNGASERRIRRWMLLLIVACVVVASSVVGVVVWAVLQRERDGSDVEGDGKPRLPLPKAERSDNDSGDGGKSGADSDSGGKRPKMLRGL